MKCPYCSAGPSQGRCSTSSAGRSITECTSCGRVIEERQTQTHHMFHLRAQDTPLLLSTSDLPPPPSPSPSDPDDPFEHTGFITAFSTWSLEHCPLFALSSLSFSGHLAELERALESSFSNSNSGNPSGGVVVDNLRAYLQIVDVASILGLEHDISDHAFQLFRDCSSATFLRNRSVEALATACLVQAIREAQEPRTLQEISIAANLPQKEIGKYIKILGEALQLSQPINSNSIAVHMPRFCNLLQLNKSAQELATHIGEVVMNKCFCTRRNPISISAAAIYLACQLEDRRKTQAEICKVTGLTEVTLRKVYKELLENWDDLLPSNYTPVVPPEKAFPTTTIASGRAAGSRAELPETAVSDRNKQPESKQSKPVQAVEMNHQERGKGDNDDMGGIHLTSKSPTSWKPGLQFGVNTARENLNANPGIGLNKSIVTAQGLEQKVTTSMTSLDKGKSEAESKASGPVSQKAPTSWNPGLPFGTNTVKSGGESQTVNQVSGLSKSSTSTQELEQKVAFPMAHHDKAKGEAEGKSGVTFIQRPTTPWRPGLPFGTISLKSGIMVPSVNPGIKLKMPSPSVQETDQKVFGSMRSNPFVAAKVFGASSPVPQSSQPVQYQTTAASSKDKEPKKYNEGKGSDLDRGR